MEAGSITVKINGDITDLQTALTKMNAGLNQVDNNSKNMTGSVLKANIAFEVIKKSIAFVVDSMKECVKSFLEQERADAMLEARLKSTGNQIGLTSNEIKKMAGELSSLTGIDDTVIQSSQVLLLSFQKISKEVFPEASKTALDLSAALGVDLQTATLQLGTALNSTTGDLGRMSRYFSDSQKETIKKLAESGDQLGAQKIILDQLNASFGGTASSIRNTFGGALTALATSTDNLQESLGGMVSVFGKDIVEAMIKGTNAITAYIQSAKGIETISNVMGASAGIFTVLKSGFISLAETLKGNIINNLKNISDKFNDVVGAGNAGKIALTLFASVISISNVVLNNMFGILKLLVDQFFNFINVIKVGAQIIPSLIDLITGKTKWEDHQKTLDNTNKAWKKFIDESIKDASDVVKGTVTDIMALPETITKAVSKMEKDFITSYDNMKSKTAQGLGGGGTQTTIMVTETDSSGLGIDTKQLEKNLSEVTSLFSSMVNNVSSEISGLAGSITSSFSNIASIMADKASTIGEKIGGIVQGIAATISSAFEIAGQALSDYNDKQLTLLTASHDSEIEAINQKLATELEMIENDGMTKEQKQAKDLAKLQADLAKETDIKKKEDLKKQISDIQKEQATTAAKKEADKQKAESDYKMAKAKWDLDKQTFEANKTMTAINAAIQYAMGLITLWANVWSMGPIAGAILGGVMTGVLTGIFAANLAIILSKNFDAPAPTAPSFAMGGISPDNTVANVNRNEMILNQDQQAELFSMLNGGNRGSQTVNLVLDGEILRTWFINNQQREAYLT